MHKLVLIRHGESTWNLENRFTGWTDVDLTPKGIEQARQAGRLLKEEGYEFDLACTSVLKRAIRTLHLALDDALKQRLRCVNRDCPRPTAADELLHLDGPADDVDAVEGRIWVPQSLTT